MKRGMILLKEVGYLVLALVMIAAVGMAFSKGCSIIQAENEKASAEGTLLRLTETLDVMNEGEQKVFVIYSPRNYYVVTFNKNEFVQCDDNCICICKDAGCLSDKSYCNKMKKPAIQKFISPEIATASLVIRDNKEGYSFDMIIEDYTDDETSIDRTLCQGTAIDVGNDQKLLSSIKEKFDVAQNYANEKNITLTVSSGLRTLAKQQEMRKKKGSLACEPKQTSEGFGLNCPHVSGCAVDVCFGDLCDGSRNKITYDPENPDHVLLRQIMMRAGFAPFDKEYWHFEYGTQRWKDFAKPETVPFSINPQL